MSETAIQYINYGSRKIAFELVYEQRKTLGIRVLPNKQVVVKAPENSTIDKIFEKVKSKAAWIIKQQNFFDNFIPLTPERKYINGETHLYFGRQYRLKIEQNDTPTQIKFDRNYITVFAKDTTPENVKKILDKWYRNKAKEWFEKLLPECMQKFPVKYRSKIQKANLAVKKMQKRWGSCTAGGNIYINPDLIKAPKASIEYVIIHELCHLVYLNHTKQFYKLQEQIMPDWEKWKNRLEYSLA